MAAGTPNGRALSSDAVPQPRRRISDPALRAALDDVRAELQVPDAFPPVVRAAAEEAAARGPRGDRSDATDLPLVTIDPPGSRDLDQAVHVRRTSGGALQVHYAIADVGAFVTPGDPVDEQAWARGVSRYSPDGVTPLHPPALSEGAASLQPRVERPAILWQVGLAADGALVTADVRRAMVRSRAQLTYREAQTAIEAGTDESLVALARLGRLRSEREWVRGGISLELPDQEVVLDGDGNPQLRYRAPLPVEAWNAQVSLLTGIAAGRLMADAGIGVLRTLPAPEPQRVQALRQQAWGLGLPWPAEIDYPAFVRTLDPHEPVEAAMISQSAVGLRGAGYAAVDSERGYPLPEDHRHEAIAAVYAHVTAPLRRLVDRYTAEVAVAIAAGATPPQWVREALPEIPRAMARARGRAAALDRAVLDLIEAWVLRPHVGRTFPATVVASDDRGSRLQLRQPAVLARTAATLSPGTEVLVRLDAVDVGQRTVTLTPL